MKRKELKQIIKPLVEECIKDFLLEGGMLSSIISEVVAGVNKGNSQFTENVQPQAAKPVEPANVQENKNNIEARKKLLDAIGTSAYNGVDVFEGTTPLKRGGKVNSGSGKGYSPFEGVDPSDPGVDITALTESLGNVWKKLS